MEQLVALPGGVCAGGGGRITPAQAGFVRGDSR